MFYREEKKTRINRRTDKDPPDAGEAGSRQGPGRVAGLSPQSGR